jgi:histidinol dehydrogenase
MKTYIYPPQKTWPQLIQRPAIPLTNLAAVVEEIFESVKLRGDAAVMEYNLRFNQVNQKTFKIKQQTIQQASKRVSAELKLAIQLAQQNIKKFHAAQVEPRQKIVTTPGVVCWRESRPIETVGIYIPGGTAPLFSTLLMLGIPAKIAGCKNIVVCTPPDKNGEINPAILYAAEVVGVNMVMATGGIQAIAAMTYGTKTIPKVDKIFGPGNQYVTAAKQKAQSLGVAIDIPAGPSEVLVVANATCNPRFVAADLLSQAEHGADSQVILVSDDKKVVACILAEMQIQLAELPRKNLATESLKNSKAIVFKNLQTCIDFSNAYAPEHLILAMNGAAKYTARITNAGSVFIGNYSCESAGDYASGTNHTLPTNGYARSYSGVSLDSFVKKITFQQISKNGIKNIGWAIECMADAEQLFAHKNAVSLRLKN